MHLDTVITPDNDDKWEMGGNSKVKSKVKLHINKNNTKCNKCYTIQIEKYYTREI